MVPVHNYCLTAGQPVFLDDVHAVNAEMISIPRNSETISFFIDINLSANILILINLIVKTNYFVS